MYKKTYLIAIPVAIFIFSPITQAQTDIDQRWKSGSGLAWTLKASNYPTFSLRHRNGLCYITTISTNLDRLDSTFMVVRGLAGIGYSFESMNYPDYFLRHQNARLKVQKNDKTILFQKDATFIARPPLNGAATPYQFSFESYNYPGYFFRHRSGEVWLDLKQDTTLYKQDASWIMSLPNGAASTGPYGIASVRTLNELQYWHNYYRLQNSKVALIWNNQLASETQTYVNTCRTSHDTNPSNYWYWHMGENMGWGYSSAKSLVDDWYLYDEASGWGHRKAILWDSHRYIGCGYKTGCQTGFGTTWACRYDNGTPRQ